MIALLDYGAGNLRSVEKALRYVGSDVELMQTPERVKEAAAVVLPGVGAFDDCINAMQRQELFHAAKEFAYSGRPFLGICVGYQAIFERSEEFNSCSPGLGIFKGSVIRFPNGKGLKIPQIGWNQIEITKSDCPLYKDVDSGSHVYFVHSFYPKLEDESIAATYTDYGVNFVSSIWKDNIFATQFHPEKSQRVGLKILENFVSLAK